MPNIYIDLAKEISTEPRTWNEILNELDSEEVELNEVEEKEVDKIYIRDYHQIIPAWNLHHNNSLEQSASLLRMGSNGARKIQ